MSKFKEDFFGFLKDVKYIIPVILTALMSFGFVVTNLSVSTDDLSDDRYFRQGELIAQGRFAPALFDKIFNIFHFRPFILDFVAVVLLVLAAILISVLFKRVCEQSLKNYCYTIFSCLFISFPLMNEIFVYTGASLMVCLGFALTALALLSQYLFLIEYKKRYFLVTVILLTLISGLYESLIAVYICGVFCVLILRFLAGSSSEKNTKTVILNGTKYVAPLVLAIIFKTLITSFLLWWLKLSPSTNGANKIKWFKEPFGETLHDLFQNTMAKFLNSFLIYLPITILMLCILICGIMLIAFTIKYKKAAVAILFFGLFLSLFALSFVQGTISPWRTCQVYALFCAFIFMLSIEILSKKLILRYLSVFAAVALVFWQSSNLNKWFYVDNLRYQEELRVLNNIGYKLQADCNLNKPVVFIGRYTLSESIRNYVYVPNGSFQYKVAKKISSLSDIEFYGSYKFVDTNVNSYINWASGAFGGEELMKFFRLNGYNLKNGTASMLTEADKQIPAYPKSGFIVEKDDYIIVNLGK